MKNTTLLTIFSAALFSLSCSNEKADCTGIEQQLSEAQSALNMQDSTLNWFNASIHEIDSNIFQVAQLEAELSKLLKSKDKNRKLRVGEILNDLEHVMESSKSQIQELETVNTSESALTSIMISVIHHLEDKVAESNQTIAEHNTELDQLGFDFKSLFQDYMQVEFDKMVLEEQMTSIQSNNSDMEAQMKEMEKSLNTAYYATGAKKTLIERGVLEKGGLINNKDINANVDKSAFEAIDIRNTSSIKLASGKAKIVTEHPKSSYEITEDASGNFLLKIKDSKEFWKLSKFLIVIED